MKRLLRGLATVMLGLAVILPTTALPARADIDNSDYRAYFDVLVSLFEKGMDGRYTPEEIAALVREVTAAINGSAFDLEAYLESVQLADVKDDILYARANSKFMQSGPIFAALYTNTVAKGATFAMSRLDIDLSDQGYDAVGRAMISLFTTTEVATKATGSFGPKQIEVYKQGLDKLVTKMTPRCVDGGLPNADLYSYTCSYMGKSVRAVYRTSSDTYTLDDGSVFAGPIDRTFVQDLTTEGTARQLARQTLDELARRGY